MHPVLFTIGKLEVFSYGVMVALGVLVAAALIYRHAQRRQMDAEKIIDLIFWIVFWGLIGGRLLYVLVNREVYLKDPWEIIKINKGGLIFHGSLIGAIIAANVFIRKNKLPLLETLDVIFLYLPFAHAIGRVGCFLNGCCAGKPTHWAGTVFTGNPIAVHCTQLYSSFLLLIIFGFLYHCEKRKRFSGEIVCLYLIVYGTGRFFMEFLRDNPTVFAGMSIFQCISIVLIIIGLILYSVLKNNKKSGKIEKKT